MSEWQEGRKGGRRKERWQVARPRGDVFFSPHFRQPDALPARHTLPSSLGVAGPKMLHDESITWL